MVGQKENDPRKTTAVAVAVIVAAAAFEWLRRRPVRSVSVGAIDVRWLGNNQLQCIFAMQSFLWAF